ncbi:MAG: hypothetical protein H6765_08835 [Candidatus Peribacteria bacterium]|nr:MAG: hypothetical protein H6765_08835 [Candidatus Peribacteria bacterium]
MLATTQKFLDRYGIATSDYGNPQVVVPQYYPYMMEDVARETYPAPQITMVEVKYPFVLDDYTVYEQYGQMYGI